MRNPDGTLNGDLNDNLPAHSSGSISFFSLSNTNENETVYDLLPVFINKPPIIISPISEASVEEGYEGIMIKSMDAPYECKRSDFWMKWKPTITVDLNIVNVKNPLTIPL